MHQISRIRKILESLYDSPSANTHQDDADPNRCDMLIYKPRPNMDASIFKER